ncbi:hypothetical protein PAMP_023278 [Pampus punctatissimus]
MGGAITCMSSMSWHKSTAGQVDDESPPVAVDVDLLRLTSMLLPLKSTEKVSRSSTRWELDTGSRTGSRRQHLDPGDEKQLSLKWKHMKLKLKKEEPLSS